VTRLNSAFENFYLRRFQNKQLDPRHVDRVHWNWYISSNVCSLSSLWLSHIIKRFLRERKEIAGKYDRNSTWILISPNKILLNPSQTHCLPSEDHFNDQFAVQNDVRNYSILRRIRIQNDFLSNAKRFLFRRLRMMWDVTIVMSDLTTCHVSWIFCRISTMCFTVYANNKISLSMKICSLFARVSVTAEGPFSILWLI